MILVLLTALSLQWNACKSPQGSHGPHAPGDSAAHSDSVAPAPVRTGADVLLQDGASRLKGKRIALVANPTSRSGNTHLVDSLLSLGITLQKVFAPEHGFRGDQDAGAHISSGKDPKTGLSIVSLYGNTQKPTPAMLADVDMVVFDIQDVGARFYTYISTLAYVMEACAEQHKPLLVLDRPNPNGWYVDGPVLEPAYKSFVGMHPVPVVHGMTLGEYARMVNAEGWLGAGKICDLTVIPCEGYTHRMQWAETGLPWVAPSPNLATEYSAYLYPILCWYEGTPVSVGRGTDMPFTLLGAPWHKGYQDRIKADSIDQMESPSRQVLEKLEMEYIRFTPRSIPGKSTHPLLEGQTCYGVHFLNRTDGKNTWMAGLFLLQNFYAESKLVGLKEPFFQGFFDKLAGTNTLKNQIALDREPAYIYDSWREQVNAFKKKRKLYLLYPDFE